MSEISKGGGGWKQREGHNFLRLRKGRVLKNGPFKGQGHANMCLWSYRGSPTGIKGSSLFGKKNSGEIGESSDQLSESESDS